MASEASSLWMNLCCLQGFTQVTSNGNNHVSTSKDPESLLSTPRCLKPGTAKGKKRRKKIPKLDRVVSLLKRKSDVSI